MRRMSILMVGFVMLAGVGLMSGQQPQPRPGGFGGFGGGFGRQDAVNLIRNPQVQKELGLTEEQVAKIPDALLKALEEVLDEKQQKRLRQIDLQQKGLEAFKDTKLQKELKITAEQVENITSIMKESDKERAELFKGARGDFKEIGEKMRTLRKETSDKVMEALNADQRKAYKQMLGDEFKLEFPSFGGGNFKKKLERPKNDQ
jgi:hypothetical protein